MENYRQLASQITLAGLFKLASDPVEPTPEEVEQVGRSAANLLGLLTAGSGAGLVGGGFGGYKLGELIADKTYGAVPGEDPVEREKELKKRRIIGGVLGVLPGAFAGNTLGRKLVAMTPYASDAMDNISNFANKYPQLNLL